MPGIKSKLERGNRMTEEQRQRILKADPSVSNGELARELGVSAGGVLYVRKKAGIRSMAPSGHHLGKAAAKPGPRPARLAAAAPTAALDVRAGLPIATIERVREQGAVSIELFLTVPQTDQIWGRMSSTSKATALRAAIVQAMS